MTVQLILGDCLEVLKGLSDGSVDLVFFDPPYGLSIAAWDASTKEAHQAATLAYDKVRDGGSLYATCSPHILAEFLGLWDVRRIIAWGKPNLPLRKNLHEWEWSTEYVLWVTKGTPRTFTKPHGEDARDYWRIAVENGFLRTDDYNHPARKPMALLRRIIEASTVVGDTILDPFMGSGTAGAVCVESGRHYIGIEREAVYFDMAKRRIAAAQVQLAEKAIP